MIKLKCSNSQCEYCYEITESELLNHSALHSVCIVCGSQLVVGNVEEIVRQDVEQRADEYLNQWIKERGLEGALELIENSPQNGVRELYMRKLKERGIIK